MKLRRNLPFVGMLLLVMTAAGCETINEDALTSMPWLDGKQDAKMNTVAAAGQYVGDDSVTLTSSHRVSRQPIRTLQEGEDLHDLIEGSSGVVLLDFYADWCGPCRKQSRELHAVEEFATEVNAQIIKVNVDEHRGLAKEY